VDPAADKESVEKAIMAAVDDVATHAVTFRPAGVSLRDAKLIGGRIYLFVVIADEAGRAETEVLETGGSGTRVERYRVTPPAAVLSSGEPFHLCRRQAQPT
jgi:hypothetical protein